jgi:hypothetical protein
VLLTDVLCYNSTTGSVAFIPSDGSTGFQESAAHRDALEPGLIVIPGRFTSSDPGSTAHGVYADILTYERTSQQLRFYSTDGRGNRTAVGPPIAAHHNWTHITPGIFTPTGAYTDLLFYDQVAGVGEFYATDGAGNLLLLHSDPSFAHWTNIVAAYFRPQAQTMDVLFYDADRGQAEFYSVWNGHITLMRSHPDWLTTWERSGLGGERTISSSTARRPALHPFLARTARVAFFLSQTIQTGCRIYLSSCPDTS